MHTRRFATRASNPLFGTRYLFSEIWDQSPRIQARWKALS